MCLCLSPLFFAACNTHDPVKEADAANKENKDSIMAPAVPTDDTHFATRAASGGMMEVQLGNVAQKSENTEVKKLGAMMVADHTKANNELKSLAARKSITLPDSMSNDDQRMVNKLSAKSGADFDKAYIEMMVNDHNEDIAMFKKEAEGGSDADLTAFAKSTLPVLQKHLDAAIAAQKLVEGK